MMTIRQVIREVLNHSDSFSLFGMVNLHFVESKLKEAGFKRVPSTDRLENLVIEESKRFGVDPSFQVFPINPKRGLNQDYIVEDE